MGALNNDEEDEKPWESRGTLTLQKCLGKRITLRNWNNQPVQTEKASSRLIGWKLSRRYANCRERRGCFLFFRLELTYSS